MFNEESSLAYTSSAVHKLPIIERVGLNIEAKNTVDALNKIRETESAGLRQVWMTVQGSGNEDTLTIYAAGVAQTNLIGVGTSILLIFTRHPLGVASQALAVNDFLTVYVWVSDQAADTSLNIRTDCR